ncbi:hypothetical protein BNJ_00436 [Kaumoebavirus]|uniref:hypothetical protein n=1 Tax=Kaumoebavirus TaxID=1859492 RepID=UPI0009C1A8C8|nr:hypothetical protein BNJ_00436 [Kaumoebavirus]ARA72248.1 hypothetical protein BNJ_00436 [Kaumoebavirus]
MEQEIQNALNIYNSVNGPASRTIGKRDVLKIADHLSRSMTRALSVSEMQALLAFLSRYRPMSNDAEGFAAEVADNFYRSVLNKKAYEPVSMDEYNRRVLSQPDDPQASGYENNAAAPPRAQGGAQPSQGGSSSSTKVQVLSKPRFDDVDLVRQYLPLDSRYQDLTNQDLTKIFFNLQPSGARITQGAIRTLKTVEKVVKMEIGTVRIPFVTGLNNYYEFGTVLINELSAQSYITNDDGDRYHFPFKVVQDGQWFVMTPTNNTFIFSEPIVRIDSLSLSFNIGDQRIEFPKDRQVANIGYGNPTVFTFLEPHNMQTGDLVYVNDFAGTPNTQDLTMNQASGLVASKLNNYQLSVPVDTSAVTGPTSITVFYGPQRIFFPITFTMLR